MFKVSYIKNKTEHKNKKRKDYKKLKTNIFKIVSWSSIPTIKFFLPNNIYKVK